MSELLFTSESVTEGHPDKVADQISDGVLDAVLAEDPAGRVACEVLCTTGLVVVAGEITTNAYVDIPRVTREIVHQIGYTSSDLGFDAATCGVVLAIDEQSPDIRRGVDSSYEEQHARAEADAGRPGSRRPGHDVRLRDARDGRADADADHARPPHRRAAGVGPQGRGGDVPAAGRQGPGDGALPPRARTADPGRDRAAAGLDPAPPGRARRRADPRRRRSSTCCGRSCRGRCARASGSTTPTSCWSTRPGASSPAARWATPA